MDLLPVFLAIAAVLLLYQVFIYKDPDQLDKTGHPVKHRKRN